MFFDKYQMLCKNIGISDTAAAEEMGFQRSVVTRWRKGAKPKNATLKIVADYFGVPVEYFNDDVSPDVTDIQKEIDTVVAKLPPEKQAEVLTFVRFLKSERKS